MLKKRLNGIRIAVVDDEAVILHVFSSIMHQAGFHTDFFTNTEKALKAISEHPMRYDILVSDIRMPGEDGIHFARKVRQLVPDLPVIFMTGADVSDERKQEALSLGRVEFLPKPFPLVETLTEMISKFASEG